jgi:hypothetical protein
MFAPVLALFLAAAPSANDAHEIFRAVTAIEEVGENDRVAIAVEACAELDSCADGCAKPLKRYANGEGLKALLACRRFSPIAGKSPSEKAARAWLKQELAAYFEAARPLLDTRDQPRFDQARKPVLAAFDAPPRAIARTNPQGDAPAFGILGLLAPSDDAPFAPFGSQTPPEQRHPPSVHLNTSIAGSVAQGDALEKAFEKHRATLESCLPDSTAGGQFSIRLELAADGTRRNLRIDESSTTLAEPAVRACLLKGVGLFELLPPEHGFTAMDIALRVDPSR